MHGHADVRTAAPDRQLVVWNRVARSRRPARLIPRRVRGEDQNIVGVRGGQARTRGRGDRSSARVGHRAIEHTRDRRAGDLHHHNAGLDHTAGGCEMSRNGAVQGGRIGDVEHADARAGAALVLVAARGLRPGLAGGVGHREAVRAVRGLANERHQEVAGVGRNGHGE